MIFHQLLRSPFEAKDALGLLPILKRAVIQFNAGTP